MFRDSQRFTLFMLDEKKLFEAARSNFNYRLKLCHFLNWPV